MSSSPTNDDYEARLHRALKEKPVAYDMWSLVRTPTKNHRIVVAMLLRTIDLCNEHNIEYWADWGTVLGALRHKNVVPWDWDFDLSFRTSEFQKMLAFEHKRPSSLEPAYAFRWYEDPPVEGYKGYDGKAYSVYHVESETLGDIVHYRDPKPGEPEGELVCEVECWEYPNWKLSDVYPLKRVPFLGSTLLLPNDPSAMLNYYTTDKNVIYSRVPWTEYDPVPFLLSHLSNPNLRLHCTPPVLEFDSKESRNAPRILKGVMRAIEGGVKKWFSSHIFKPSFLPSALPRDAHIFVQEGRFEFLAIPPHVTLPECMARDVAMDALMWDCDGMWGNMYGGYACEGDFVVVPKGWNMRVRVIVSSETGKASCA
eukprot:PhF_6_TR30717/c0_g1_i1/m.45202